MKASINQFRISKALSVLEGLKRSENGRVLLGHLDHLLTNNEARRIEVQRCYAAMVDLVQKAYCKQLSGNSPLRAHLNNLSLRLVPPLSELELRNLQDFISRYHPVAVDTKEIVTQTIAQIVFVPGQQGAHGDKELRHLSEVRNMQNEVWAAAKQLTDNLVRQNEEWGIFLDVALEAVHEASDAAELHRLRELISAEAESMVKLQQTQRRLLANALRDVEYTSIKSSQPAIQTAVVEAEMLDTITQLPNRRAFMQRLEDEVGRVQRYCQPLSLAMIDVDKFSKLKDKYGEAASDIALTNFSAMLRAMARREDCVAHYSLDEFAILMPCTEVGGAHLAMSNIKTRLAAEMWRYDEKEFPYPMLCAGVGAYVAGETPTGFVTRVYDALYRGKRLGSGRIELDVPQDNTAIFAS